MKRLAFILTIITVGVWSYLIGTILPAVVNTTPSIVEFLHEHDRGCSSIVRRDDKLICEIIMESEDDPIYIVKY